MKPIFSKVTDKLNLTAKLSDDRIKLFIDVEKLSEGRVLEPELMALVAEFVKPDLVDRGIIADVIEVLNRGDKVEERRIVKGRDAQVGPDGKLLLLVKKLSGQAEIKSDQKGFVNYQEMNLFDNIKVGQIVARVYPEKPGMDGQDALGQVIPSKPGKPYKPNLDRTLVLKQSERRDDGFEVIEAQAEGLLAEESGKLLIRTELLIDGDLDYRFGNLDFCGSIKIRGSVPHGFVLKARKGIEIQGDVNGASLFCSEGDILCKGFVTGSEGAKIVSGKSLQVRVAQEATAEAAGDILVEKEAFDCDLRTGASLVVKEGALTGGKAMVVSGAQAKLLGNKAGAETDVTLCSDIETTAAYSSLLIDMENHERAIGLIKLHLGPLWANPARIVNLLGSHKAQMQKLYDKLIKVEMSHDKLKERRLEMLAKGRLNRSLRVNFVKSLFPGVCVKAGGDHWLSDAEVAGPKSIEYEREKHEFSMVEMKPLEYAVSEGVLLAGGKDDKGNRK